MSLLMLGWFGLFPVGVALGGALVPVLGPVLLFPIGAAISASAIVGALTQREVHQL